MEMEAEQGEDSTTSSEETSLSNVVNEDFGHGQLYECMFCKRGFSTAQALGGHMNIHRRDRARMRQQSLPPNPNCRSNEHPIVTAFCPQIPGTQVNYIPPFLESSRDNQIYRLAHPSGSRHPQRSRGNDGLDMLNTQYLDSYSDDLCLRLGNLADPQRLWIGEQRNRQDEEDGELDLELRLGHQP